VKINQKPVILAPLNFVSVLDILPYYKEAVEIKSFAGIPIYQRENVVGVLTLDSFEQNSFDNNVISYVGNLTKLLSSLITSLTEKFDLMVSAKTLEAINRFRTMLKEPDVSFDQILIACFNTIKEILGFENIGFCNFSKATNCWKVQALQGNQVFADKLTNATINTSSALIAKTLFKKETLFLAPIGKSQTIVADIEPFISEGYFASVALQSLNSNYGAIFVYGDNHRNITANDVKILGILAEQIASTIEKYLYINIYQSYSTMDPFSGIYTPKGLHQQLDKELAKAKDMKHKLSFVTIQIDNYDSYRNVPGIDESIHKLVSEYLKTKTRKYDSFGNVSESVFGMIILSMSYDEIRIWADQMRKEIANKIVSYDNQKFMVTISIGISYLTANETIDEIISNSINMLKISAEKKNIVNIY
jgi:diguanylate cyclase (GGDEF)-like protein